MINYKDKAFKYIKKLNILQQDGKGLLCTNLPSEIISDMVAQIKYNGNLQNDFQRENGKYVIKLDYGIDELPILLGKGTFGNVYKGILYENISTTEIKKRPIVIKVMEFMKDSAKEALCYELTTLYNHKTPYAVDYLGYAEDDETQYVFMEYINGNDLYDYILNNKNKNLEKKISITRQLLLGLRSIHHNNIVHRDIKPENIMIDKLTGFTKYIDFGFSCKNNQSCSTVKPWQGSPNYISPEFIKNMRDKTPNHTQYMIYDIWALGCTIYSLFASKLLVDGPSSEILFDNILLLTDDKIQDKINRNIRVPAGIDGRTIKMENNLIQIKKIITELLRIDHTKRKLYLMTDVIPDHSGNEGMVRTDSVSDMIEFEGAY